MSNTQSILELTRETYFEESQKHLLSLSDDYFFNKKLFIGEGVDRDKMRFYMQTNRFMCEDNCTITDYIKDKIEGKLSDCNVRINKKYKRLDTLKLCRQHLSQDNCLEDDTINCVPTWNEVAW